MINRKYEFTGETIELMHLGQRIVLRQIRATASFGDVKAGELGGWIASEKNLDHNGEAWVAGSAKVFGDAHVYENARVFGSALVFDKAWIYGCARVFGYTWISGNSRISGDARVYGDIWISGNTRVSANACISSMAHFLTIGPIGSREGYTTFFLTACLDIAVKCGCFSGSLAEFAAAVKKTHGDSKHGQAYRAAIELAKLQINLNKETSY